MSKYPPAFRTPEKVFGFAQGRTVDLFAVAAPARDRFIERHYFGHDGHLGELPDFGTAPLRLLGTGFGYLNFLVRSCREPFGGDQNASICLISKQSEQLRLFLVGLRKR
jgi:hypothetical protein